MYNIKATIFDVDMFNDWKYVPCKICRSKTKMVDGYYYCEKCTKNVVNPTQG